MGFNPETFECRLPRISALGAPTGNPFRIDENRVDRVSSKFA